MTTTAKRTTNGMRRIRGARQAEAFVTGTTHIRFRRVLRGD